MKPLDPRLVRHAKAARGYIILAASLGVILSGLVVAQAIIVARVVGTLASGGQVSATEWRASLIGIGLTTAGRAVTAWLRERYAHRAASHTIAELRLAVIRHIVALGPRWAQEDGRARATQLVTRGLDALDAYFARYLPQLLMVVTVTPILLITTGFLDWISSLILFVTIPLIPLFMWLIGRVTEEFSARRLKAMTRLGAQVLDLISGLPTMKAFGREKGPAGRVRELSNAHAKATFGTVRVAFLSGAALELIATLSVALVAVSVGLRLDAGRMSLVPALAVIMVAPEVLLPLRNVGAHYHASTNGVAASSQVFDILSIPLPSSGDLPAPDLAKSTIRLDGLSAKAPGRAWTAPADLSGKVPPGQITALTGPNGAGKSTTVNLILGLVQPSAGRVVIESPDGSQVDLAQVDLTSWWPQIAWVPQRPVLEPGTVLENLTQDFGQYVGAKARTGEKVGLGEGGAKARTRGNQAKAADDAPGARADDLPEAVVQAAQATGLDEVVAGLPQGWDTLIGQGGVGLSVGQRQRLALARAMLAHRPLVILDEPTAHLDAVSEKRILETIDRLARQGTTVLVVAHRPTLLASAHHRLPVAAEAAGQEVPA
ncbi:MAG: thiol reductant ABC exporter subunit CydD [Micrococcales bacterium]|nr:thiol reductant ABC exporter subunit CydD [Micrococcales bacterium]